MKWIYLQYLRIRYFNRTVEVIGRKQYKELDIVTMKSPFVKSICENLVGFLLVPGILDSLSSSMVIFSFLFSFGEEIPSKLLS